jgi:hypothetical protein
MAPSARADVPDAVVRWGGERALERGHPVRRRGGSRTEDLCD